jgi:hypothetical protein
MEKARRLVAYASWTFVSPTRQRGLLGLAGQEINDAFAYFARAKKTTA